MSDGIDTVADLIRRDAASKNAPAMPGTEARMGDTMAVPSSSKLGAAGPVSPAAPLSDEEALVRCLRAWSDRVRVVATPEGQMVRLKLLGTCSELHKKEALGLGLALIDAAMYVGAA